MTLNKEIENNVNFSNQSHPSTEIARLIEYNKGNTKQFKNKNRNPNLTNKFKSSLNINWDDLIDIETCDSDSINSETSKAANIKKPKLFTFYDYINKDSNIVKSQKNQAQKNKSYLNFENYHNNFHNSSDYTYKFRRPQNQDFDSFTNFKPSSSGFQQNKMPISSGFGGYTTTTRKINNQVR